MIKNCIYCNRLFQNNHENKCKFGKKAKVRWYKTFEEIFSILEIKFFFEKDDGPEMSFAWKGSDKGMNLSYPFHLVLHEFSHWITSNSDRRKFANFGFHLLETNEQKLEEYKVILLEKLLKNSLCKK